MIAYNNNQHKPLLTHTRQNFNSFLQRSIDVSNQDLIISTDYDSFSEDSLFNQKQRQSSIDYLEVAALYLKSYESRHSAVLLPHPQSPDLKNRLIQLYSFHVSKSWRMILLLTTVCCFYMSSQETDRSISTQAKIFWCSCLGYFVFGIDIMCVLYLSKKSKVEDEIWWCWATATCLILMLVECFLRLWIIAFENQLLMVLVKPCQITSILKPVLLLYEFQQARDTATAFIKVIPVAMRVLFMEVFIVFMFSLLSFCLYSDFEQFSDLPTSFISMFELSTTVVNPSVWVGIYEESRNSAFFFCLFGFICVFYIHSLVLSVVFSSYMKVKSAMLIKLTDKRDEKLQLAFEALLMLELTQQMSEDTLALHKPNVKMENIKNLLCKVRPYYNEAKVNGLSAVVNPFNDETISFEDFDKKIPKALNAKMRLRSAVVRNSTSYFELFAALVATLNLIFVLWVCLASDDNWWILSHVVEVGFLITLLCILELFTRVYLLEKDLFLPFSGKNSVSDSINVVSILVSMFGVYEAFTASNPDTSWISLPSRLVFAGRTLDLIRVLRFVVPDLVRRTGEVIPNLAGPVLLVFTSSHIFCYFGMFLWAEKITHENSYSEVEEYYDLNNFNSWQEGLVTIYQCFIVNDWHQIAKVFLNTSSSFLVYLFFIGVNLFGVNVVLNIMVAFFVAAFMDSTKRYKGKMRVNSSAALDKYSVRHGGASTSVVELDVFERERFSQTVHTIAGESNQLLQLQKQFDLLESCMSLAFPYEKIGLLIAYKSAKLHQVSNKRFNEVTRGVITTEILSQLEEKLSSAFNSGTGSAVSTRKAFDTFDLDCQLIKGDTSRVIYIARQKKSKQGSAYF